MFQKVTALTLIRDGEYCLQKDASDELPLQRAAEYKAHGWVKYDGEPTIERQSQSVVLEVDDVIQEQGVTYG